MPPLSKRPPFDLDVIGVALPDSSRGPITRYALRHEVQQHRLPEGHEYSIVPYAFATRYPETSCADILHLAYWHFTEGWTQPLIIEVPFLTRKEALVYAWTLEARLIEARDHVPYTIEWWYRTPAEGHKACALFGLGHIGLEALVGI